MAILTNHGKMNETRDMVDFQHFQVEDKEREREFVYSPVSQKIRFIHEMSREHNYPVLAVFTNDVPSKTPRERIHAAGGFVEEDNFWIATKSNRDR